MPGVPAFNGRELDLELLDARSVPLCRLFRHPNGEWDPPPVVHRTLRVDPPTAHGHRYAVLYTSDQLPCVAAECRVLSIDQLDRWSYHAGKAKDYQVARYSFAAPALFIPIDGPNARHLGLDGESRLFDGKAYEPYQEVGLELFTRYGEMVHGLSWASFHRNQLGRVYAIWHHRKASMQLARPIARFTALEADPEWLAFLAKWPSIRPVSP